jgi:ABC-2 type transport system ATP-binding protein
MTEPRGLKQPPPREDDDSASSAVFVKDVVKSFPISLTFASWLRHRGRVPRRTVLHEISLTVRPREVFGLLGPNGAGKTTLLKLLATLCIADSGTIIISGIDATKKPMAVRTKIGFCTSEERSFYFRLTARENLRFFGSLEGLFGDALERRIDEVISQVDLGFAAERRFDTFSSGMRQRLSVARALLADPEVIFFDEPTRAVDPLHAREIREMIRKELVARRGKTAVVATNALDEAWSICDTVAILQQGRIVAQGSPESLDARFTQYLRYWITLKHTSEQLERTLRSIAGVHRITSSSSEEGIVLDIELDPKSNPVGELLRIITANGAVVSNFRSVEPRPLDVFVGITQNGNSR